MAEPATARVTEREVLAAVAAERVADNDAAYPLLDGNGDAAIADEVWRLYRLGWVHQLDGERLWRLTYRGRDVLQGRVPNA